MSCGSGTQNRNDRVAIQGGREYISINKMLWINILFDLRIPDLSEKLLSDTNILFHMK